MKLLLITLLLWTAGLSTCGSAENYAQTARNFRVASFANLGSPNENNTRWCPDCNATAPCTSGGSGAYAYANGTAWNCSEHTGGGGGGGGVSSVGLSLPSIFTVSGSPVTSSGTLTGTLANQSANRIFAGPTSGGSAAPTFRALVAADLGTGTATGSTCLLGDLTWGACAAGSVTSVGLSVPVEFAVSGSPITGSGTLTVSKAAQSANLIYASPSSGAPAAPGFRALVEADLSGFTDMTTANATNLKHGLLPKLSGSGSDCLRGDGGWSFCAGSGGGDFSTSTTISTTNQLLVAATTGGKTGTFFTGSGVAIMSSGVVSTKTNPAGAFVGDTDTQTLTNKTISGASNTISNLATSSVTSGVFAIGRLATGTPDGTKFVRDDGTLAVPAGTGVTSVAATVPTGFAISGSPITSTGTLAITYAGGQTANRFLATPNGSAGALSLRAIVPADFFTGTININRCVRVNASGQVETASGDCATGGTVTSFSSGNLSPLFTTSVANATTTPALSFTLTNQAANLVYAGPTTGAAAAPTFRSLVAADIPAITESKLSFSDITTANASASAHGLLPKLSGSGSDCFRGDGSWLACGGGSGGGDFSTNTTISVANQVVVASGTGGKTGTFATGSGVGILTAGVLSFKTNPSGAFVGDTDAQSLSNKTLVTPTIASFTNAQHNHSTAALGGQLTLSAFTSTTGTGATVGQQSPSLITPNIGVAVATSINKVAITTPTTSATLTIANLKTLAVNNTLTFTGTDGTTLTTPSATDTLIGRASTDTITGTKTFNAGTLIFGTRTTNTTVVANSIYRNSTDGKLYIGSNDGTQNRELFEAGVSGPISVANGGTGKAAPAGMITLSGATSGSFSFPAAYNAAPKCAVTPRSDLGSGIRFWYSSTTTAITVNTSSSVSASFDFVCVGNPN